MLASAAPLPIRPISAPQQTIVPTQQAAPIAKAQPLPVAPIPLEPNEEEYETQSYPNDPPLHAASVEEPLSVSESHEAEAQMSLSLMQAKKIAQELGLRPSGSDDLEIPAFLRKGLNDTKAP
jgi:hypothetical protein